MKIETLPQFVRSVERAARDKDLVFLVGAGISMLPPTSLPSGLALKRLVMAGITADASLRQDWNRARRLHRFRNIVPEIVFQRVYECLDDKFDPAFDALKIAVPNPTEPGEGIANYNANGSYPGSQTLSDLMRVDRELARIKESLRRLEALE